MPLSKEIINEILAAVDLAESKCGQPATYGEIVAFYTKTKEANNSLKQGDFFLATKLFTLIKEDLLLASDDVHRFTTKKPTSGPRFRNFSEFWADKNKGYVLDND